MKRKLKSKKLHIALIVFLVVALDFVLSTMGRMSRAAQSDLVCPYIFQVSTGVSNGEGIGAFRIVYTDDKGERHSNYILPNDGDLQKSLRRAEDVGGVNGLIIDSQMYTGNGFDSWSGYNVKGLQSNTTDTYLVNFYHHVATIEQIDIIPATEGKSIDWQCNGMRLYEVGKTNGNWDIYGVGMRGYLSDSYYIRFSGTLKYAVYNDGYKTLEHYFRAGNDANLYSIKAPGIQSRADVYLYNNGFPAEDIDYTTEDDTVYQFKIDFAEKVGAGIESYSNLYGAEKKTIPAMQLPESLMCTVSYVDKHGANMQVRIPAISSFLTAMRKEGCFVNGAQQDVNRSYAVDIAGQGESIVFPLFLPECVSVNYVKFDYDVSNLDSKYGYSERTGAISKNEIRKRMTEKKDNIAVTSFSIMEHPDTGAPRNYDATYPYMDFVNNASLKAEDAKYPVRWYYNSNRYEGIEMTLNHFDTAYQVSPYIDNVALKPSTNNSYYLFAFHTDDMEFAGSESDISVSIEYRATSGKMVRTDPIPLATLAQNFYGFWPDKNGEDVSVRAGMHAGNTVYGILNLECVDAFEGVNFTMTNGSDDWQIKNVQIFQIETLSPRVGYWLDGEVEVGSHVIDRTYSRVVNGIPVYDESLLSGLSVDDIYGTTPNGTNPDGTNPDGTNPDGTNPDGTNPDGTNPDGTNPNGGSNKLDGSHPSCVLDIDLTLNINNKKSVTVSFDGKVKKETAFEWMETYRDRMSYEITRKDLGFNSTALTYQVNVEIPKDKDDGKGNGDAGSANLFYFQLIFANGNSGFVLANQQLMGDCFHANATNTFYINVNKDYGKLLAIKVIPDATQSNANLYDKLYIDRISVTNGLSEDDTGKNGIVNDFIFDVKDWVGFDTEDDAKTLQNKSLDELANTFYITENAKSVYTEFVLEMDDKVATTDESIRQFEGSVWADISYIDDDGNHKSHYVDVVGAMYEYRNQNAVTDTVSEKERGISDPSSMFRYGHSDRFKVKIPNLRTLQSITFTFVDPKANAYFNIKGVVVNKVASMDKIVLNQQNEYEYVTQRTRVAYNVGYLDKESDGQGNQIRPVYCPKGEERGTPPIYFVQERADAFELTNDERFDYKIEDDTAISYIPADTKEWLTIYGIASENRSTELTGDWKNNPTPIGTKPSSSRVQVAYRDDNGKNHIASMNATAKVTENNEIEYTLLKLPVKDVRQIQEISIGGEPMPVQDGSLESQRAMQRYEGLHGVWQLKTLYVQHYVNGSIEETYSKTIEGVNSYVDTKTGALFSELETINAQDMPIINQGKMPILYVQLGDITDNVRLIPETKDIAFRIYYTSDTFGSAEEQRSKYIYLSDILEADPDADGVVLKDHQWIEIPFTEIAPTDIKSIEVAATGGMNIMIDRMAVGIYKDFKCEEVEKWYSFYDADEPLEITNRAEKFLPTSAELASNDALVPVEIELKTGDSTVYDDTTGTSDPISMSINYIDRFGAQQIKVYSDITPYVCDGDFTDGNTAIIKLLEPGMNNIQSVHFRPFDKDMMRDATWTLESMKITYGKVVASANENIQVHEDTVFVKEKITESQGKTVPAYNMSIVMTATGANGITVNSDGNDYLVVDAETGKAEISYAVQYAAQYVRPSTGITVKIYQYDNGVKTDVTKDLAPAVSADKISITFPENTGSSDVVYEVEASGSGNYSEYKRSLSVHVPKKKPKTEDSTDSTTEQNQ